LTLGSHGWPANAFQNAAATAGVTQVTHLSDLAINPAREATPSLFADDEIPSLEIPHVENGAAPRGGEQPPYRPAALGKVSASAVALQLPATKPVALPPIVEMVVPQDPATGGAGEIQDQVVQDPPPGRIDASSRFSDGWRLKRVDELLLNVHAGKQRPENAAEQILEASAGNGWPVEVGSVAWWIAPNLTYQPLVFEDARLERFGYASPYFAIQPIRSGLHFTNSALLAPLRVWSHRKELESPLAFERPGSYAPPRRELFIPAIGH
jgi:hypothetical protein